MVIRRQIDIDIFNVLSYHRKNYFRFIQIYPLITWNKLKKIISLHCFSIYKFSEICKSKDYEFVIKLDHGWVELSLPEQFLKEFSPTISLFSTSMPMIQFC